jgi:hypothetical protein
MLSLGKRPCPQPYNKPPPIDPKKISIECLCLLPQQTQIDWGRDFIMFSVLLKLCVHMLKEKLDTYFQLPTPPMLALNLDAVRVIMYLLKLYLCKDWMHHCSCPQYDTIA